MATTLYNVSNRLPVTVGETIKRSSGGLVAALEGLSKDQFQARWIGWPGAAIEDSARQKELTAQLESEYQCTPVFLSDALVAGYYEGFANTSLWPLLHYLPSYFRYETPWWDDYQQANQHFADQVLSHAHDGDIVWVHDYQLMLLPALLKQANPNLHVGFFLHTPFPSYELFRFHPRRAELLAGVLGADQIGFHTFGYLRHFRSAALRLLGADAEMMRVRHEGHTASLGVYPIGINAGKFAAQLKTPEHAEKLKELAAAHGNKRVVLSVERLDYTKGILHRLEAIDAFLEHSPDAGDVKFIFVSVPSREGVEAYRSLREDVESRVGRINGKYATLHATPIHFIHGSVTFAELCALYALAEVALVTPLIDGMNLVAKEYIACQKDNAGVLVLSEFAGAAEELFSALIVNPYDGQAVQEALAHALAMSPEEKQARMKPMRQRVAAYDAQRWARSFVEDLAARPAQADAASTNLREARDALIPLIAAGKPVALFLDYDGTLREFERTASDARPHAALVSLLDRLAQRPNLLVTIISGRTPDDLDRFLGHYGFGLVAEHGAALRKPHQTQWEHPDRNVSFHWKQEISPLLDLYETSTPGSYVEDKRTSLVWHYRKADPEFGAWKAAQLAEELATLTANEPITIRHGKKIVEITPTHVNKGAAVTRILETSPAAAILCAGDDLTDESMFTLDLPGLVTIKVGPGETRAGYRVATPAALRRFLESLLVAAPAVVNG